MHLGVKEMLFGIALTGYSAYIWARYLSLPGVFPGPKHPGVRVPADTHSLNII